MQQQTTNLQRDITAVIVWSIATPTLTIWFLLSLLPLVSVIGAWGDPLAVLVAVAFFATGAVGLLSGLAASRLLTWETRERSVTPPDVRTRRVALLSAYALVWMAVYSIYSTV